MPVKRPRPTVDRGPTRRLRYHLNGAARGKCDHERQSLRHPEHPDWHSVVGFGDALLGRAHEIYLHDLLVREEGQHTDFEVPVHAIRGLVDGKLHVSVNRASVTEIDDEETAHRQQEERR